jgi:hypothetical protein
VIDNSKKRGGALTGWGSGDSAAAKNQLTGGRARRYGRGVTHPLLDRLIVRAVERAATERLGWA